MHPEIPLLSAYLQETELLHERDIYTLKFTTTLLLTTEKYN